MEKNYSVQEREKVIVQTSVIGILTNILLAGFKAVIGLVSHSIAITLDAVNNLSDALSSVITIIGAKLGGKAPNKEHPLGYGRVEYLSALLVSAIVLYAGITSLVESIKKIIRPTKAEYEPVSLIIIAVAVVAKILLGRFVKKKGEQIRSSALVASGSDALFDAILSLSVLASAIIFLLSGLSLEAFVGLIISAFIIRSGLEMTKDTLDDILGRRADPELAHRIKDLLREEPEILGAYDLILNNYGPDKNFASVHLELPDTMTVDELDHLTRRIEKKIYVETGVGLTGVSVYSYSTKNAEISAVRDRVKEIVTSHDWVLEMHGFHLHPEERTMRFDAVLSFEIDRGEAVKILHQEVSEAYPDYRILVIPDADLSD